MHHILFKDKIALVRVDFNVPLDKNFKVTDHTRIEKAIPTLRYILDQGAKLVVCTHLGRPKVGADNGAYSTNHIRTDFEKLLGSAVYFVDDCIGKKVQDKVSELKKGETLLLENTRFYDEETAGDHTFAKSLASLADIYINDAFGTAHRAHASTTTVAEFFDKDHKGFGYLMEAEVANGQKILNNPKRPLTAIVGGAKVSDKIQLLEQLINLADHILIGGGMAYTFLKASGGNIGKSLCEYEYLDLANKIIAQAKAKGCTLHLPFDSVIADKFGADAASKISNSAEILEDWMGLDIGPKAISDYTKVILESKTLLWNGPMGVFEFESFNKGTFGVANAVAMATDKGAYSLIGGGDSVAAINQSGLENRVSYVSTGGGAMLEFLEGKILPGVAAILN
jgi:phosphoglycerate kinase